MKESHRDRHARLKPNPDYQRRRWGYRLKTKHGISIEAYEAMMSKSNGACWACGDPPGQRRLHVDHDHDTGVVRGLLCLGCNVALGSLREDPVRIEKLAEYIRCATS